METVNSSSGRCWSSEVYCPVPGTMDNAPSSNDYKVYFPNNAVMNILYDSVCRITYSTKCIVHIYVHVCRYSIWAHSRPDMSGLFHVTL
jgi:hypothetical protein